jgi:predicted RNase H-like nuclease (RuvC/YqgF family)
MDESKQRDAGADQGSLEECEAELDHLREENQQLRASAEAFGELAERLKQVLEGERGRASHEWSGTSGAVIDRRLGEAPHADSTGSSEDD